MSGPTTPAVAFSIRISEITLSDGQQLSLNPDSVVLIVGPNNAGKSSLLKDIYSALSGDELSPVTKKVKFLTTNGLGLSAWLSANIHTSYTRELGFTYEWMGHRARQAEFGGSLPEVINSDRGAGPGGRKIAPFLCSLYTVKDRATVCESKKSFDPISSAPKEPLHLLAREEALEQFISHETRIQFGEEITVDRGMCEHVEVKWGRPPQPQKGTDRASLAYRQELGKLPSIYSQGHGIQSFVGALLLVKASVTFIRLLDEPELFLHPPHAWRLGHILAGGNETGISLAQNKYQLIMATHSSAFLKGVLEAASERVIILRVARTGNVNTYYKLDAKSASDVLKQPLVKYSTALDAVFHDVSVICEGDADCRFFGALLDVLPSGKEDRRVDTHFTWCGGKDRAPDLIRATRGLGVETRVILDMDALRREDLVKSLVESFGGDWPTLRGKYIAAVAAVGANIMTPTIKDLRDNIEKVFTKSAGKKHLDQEFADEVKKLLRFESEWDNIKLAGVSAFPNGEPRKAIERFLDELERLGIWLLRVGELERFAPTIGGSSAKWVSNVLEQLNLGNAAELETARVFIRNVVKPVKIDEIQVKKNQTPELPGA